MGKLDQSLDEILSSQRKNSQGRRRSQRRSVGAKPAAAPAGGIQKTTKPARTASKPASGKGAGLTGESKIMVSNLVCHTPHLFVCCMDPFANFCVAQGCFRSADQGMLLPVRLFTPSDFVDTLHSRGISTHVQSSVDLLRWSFDTFSACKRLS